MELFEPGCATKSMEFATIQSLKAGLGHNGGVQGKKASNRVGREHCSSTVQPISHAQFQARSKSSTALKGRGKTLHLPLFCSVDSRAFVSWLYEVECYFESNHFFEEKKSKLVISCLKGDALTWFRNATCANKDGMFKCKYWHKLKSSLKKMYLNKAVMNDLENEFKNLKMDSLCVKDYAMMFNELYFICGNPNDDSKKLNLFYNGLNSEIQNWINIEQISSFELLCELALTSEYLIHEHEVHMESLARENAKHNVVVSYSKGLGHEVPLSYGLTSKDKTTVPMSVLGAELHVAYAQLTELSSEFPWKCWSPKDVIGMSNQHITCLGCRCEPPDLCALSAEALGMDVRPRHFMMIFDPGGIDNVPSLEVHLSKGV